MTEQARYSIGIDLGTTNCALCYTDHFQDQPTIQNLKILQWQDSQGTIEADGLPSFIYLPPKNEWRKGQLNLGFNPEQEESEPSPFMIGTGAKAQAEKTADRVIHSAKSWLANGHVDRLRKILPWNSDDIQGDHRISPVEASALYLQYLKDFWNHTMGAHSEQSRFENQDITITVPASFDEVASRLTLEAAKVAGYPQKVKLLEEPVAAFKAYLSLHPEITKELAPDRKSPKVLVCDIGGGTTDFSLITLDRSNPDDVKLIRSDVSDHILLGGDNIDLAISHTLESQLSPGQPLQGKNWGQLVTSSRILKEKNLNNHDFEEKDEELFVSLTINSRNLFGGTLTTSISTAKLRSLILDGFFPSCPSDAKPETAESSLFTFGLPYATDTAFTRHLAGFLKGQSIDAVVFAGGTLKPAFLRQKILHQISQWQGFEPEEYCHPNLDLAIAQGAATNHNKSHKIAGGYPRSIFAELSSEQGETKMVCLVPKGYTGDKRLVLNQGIKVRTGEAVKFQLSSSSDLSSQEGEFIKADQSLVPLPALITKLKTPGKKAKPKFLAVQLETQLTATGVLDLNLVSKESNDFWNLEFQTQSGPIRTKVRESEAGEPQIPPQLLSKAHDLLQGYYGSKGGSNQEDLKNITRQMEKIFDLPRQKWPFDSLRALWSSLAPGVTRRGRSRHHEHSFLHLAGYILRPGFGDSKDPFRIEELWRCYELGLNHSKDAGVLNQWWIMWRRVAGGLNKAQQEALFKKIYPTIIKGEQVTAEMLLLAGSLENIDINLKTQLGQKLVDQMTRSKHLFDQKVWALARIATRTPLYGGPETIIRAATIEKFAEKLDQISIKKDPKYRGLALFYASAGRKIANKELDIDHQLRLHFLDRLKECRASEEQILQVEQVQAIDYNHQSKMFGEDLPTGFIYEHS